MSSYHFGYDESDSVGQRVDGEKDGDLDPRDFTEPTSGDCVTFGNQDEHEEEYGLRNCINDSSFE